MGTAARRDIVGTSLDGGVVKGRSTLSASLQDEKCNDVFEGIALQSERDTQQGVVDYRQTIQGEPCQASMTSQCTLTLRVMNDL